MDSNALFTWISVPKERSYWKQDWCLQRWDWQRQSRWGLNRFLLPVLKWFRRKENALHLQSAERPLCLQIQMVPLTLASLINLMFHRLLMEGSYLLWASSYVLMEKQVVFCCLNPFCGSLVPLKWSWIPYWGLQTIPHGPPTPLMNLWLHLLPTVYFLSQSQ